MAKEPSVRRPGARINWTEVERSKVIVGAANAQRDHPDLSGLPLLRVAILVLPDGRRRKVIALSKVPWFEPGLAEEIKRRTLEELATEPIKTTLVNHAATVETLVESSDEWKGNALRFYESSVGLLTKIHKELRSLNDRLSQPKTPID